MSQNKTQLHCLSLLTAFLILYSLPTLSEPQILLTQTNSMGGFLHPDQAFQLSASRTKDNLVVLEWEIAPDYYLYRDQLQARLYTLEGHSTELTQTLLANAPTAKPKYDEAFGDTYVYLNALSIRLLLPPNTQIETDVLEIRHQGCAEAGLCYPPKKTQLNLNTLPIITSDIVAAATPREAAPFISEQGRLTNILKTSGLPLICLTFLGLGLLLSLTPCEYPMIPILSALLIGQGDQLNARRGFVLSLVYVLAMASTYAVLGILTGMMGANLQAMFQHPAMIYGFALLLIVFALASFDVWHFSLPSGLQNKLVATSQKQGKTSFIGASIMGALSALLVGACLAPPLAAVLIYIGQTGQPLTGGLALFSMGFGLGVPLLIMGTSAGKLLPKAGPWMTRINHIFGTLLIALAIWWVGRILPDSFRLTLWAIWFFWVAWLLYSQSSFKRAGNIFTKTTATLSMTYGILLSVAATTQGTSMLHPIAHLTGNSEQYQAIEFIRIKSYKDLQQELVSASQARQPVILDFYADWCTSCLEMEYLTFSDTDVKERLKTVRLLQADVTKNDDADQALMKKLAVLGPPTLIFFGADGQENIDYRLIGMMGPKPFLNHLETALK